jgi:phage tail sheath protein FI
MTQTPAPIEPETKDWTVVIADGCSECGFSPHDVTTTGEWVRGTIPKWQERLAQPDASQRPQPQVWSPVEYGAHVRDVCHVFRQRLELMLTEDNPTFADWDQDAAAVEDDYFHQPPAEVAAQYAAQAEQTAAAFDRVTGDQWRRPSRRSNGSRFTVETFATYFKHDLQHHLHDVTR